MLSGVRGQCALGGTWYSQLGSEMILEHGVGSAITGEMILERIISSTTKCSLLCTGIADEAIVVYCLMKLLLYIA